MSYSFPAHRVREKNNFTFSLFIPAASGNRFKHMHFPFNYAMISRMNLLHVFELFSFLLGCIVGSFLNVVIYRIPRKESIVFPGSHCPNCGHNLSPWENIPILSFLFLKGSCRNCGVKISLQYPFVELLTGVCFAFVTARFGLTFQTLVYLLFSATLISLSGIDLHTRLLPDAITLPGTILACALSLCTLFPGFREFWPVSPGIAFSGMAAGAGPLILISWLYFKITKREGLGGGDIKLMLFIGALTGPLVAILTIFLGAFIGTLVGIPLTMTKSEGRRFEIPFGPFLSGAAWIAALWGKDIMDWYLRLSGIA